MDSGTTDKILGEDGTIDENGIEIDFNLVLDGTDGSSTNAGDNLIYEFADGRHKLVPEDWSAGSENHLVLETADDATSDITNKDVKTYNIARGVFQYPRFRCGHSSTGAIDLDPSHISSICVPITSAYINSAT